MWGRRQILHWLLAKVVWPGYNLPFQGLIEWSPFFKKRPWPIQRENAECLSKYAFAEWPDFSQMFWISSSGQSGGYYTVIGKTFHLPLLTFLYLLHFQLPRPIFYKIWSKKKRKMLVDDGIRGASFTFGENSNHTTKSLLWPTFNSWLKQAFQKLCQIYNCRESEWKRSSCNQVN